ncbi:MULTISPECIES: universal stress protein [unclassified Arthrobacter]|uniref:universal stress protein n=1 Tax=unclassified Arthrobacter TaxID=235627 RepID=UPI0014929404|nr:MULTISPECIES: universal stress protein [unclassified Arthrobacter]MBE0010871.1 universal stress protein [Arthrobacter sp. AET 35A]NOJ64730.1 universal stress protein [Arthrobacter sp. 147(2020)]
MNASKPIAVATTDNAQSQAAVRWAARRAERLKLPLVILYVVDDRWVTEPIPWANNLLKLGEQLLENTARRVRADHQVEVTTKLLEGGVAGKLGQYSSEASLLVVGSGSVHLGGSLTDRALQIAATADCPVAVIGPQEIGERRGVAVGVDGSEEAIQAVAFAAAEADRDGQELVVVYALQTPNHLLDEGLLPRTLTQSLEEEERVVLSETVSGIGEDYPDLAVRKVLETDREPAAALLHAAANAALLVVGSRGRGGFRRLLLGSTAHAVLHHLPCPTVVTPLHSIKHLD